MDIMIALWAAIAGALFLASPFAAEELPGAFVMIEAVGRSVYAIALALCVLAIALRFVRRTGGTDRTSDR